MIKSLFKAIGSGVGAAAAGVTEGIVEAMPDPVRTSIHNEMEYYSTKALLHSQTKAALLPRYQEVLTMEVENDYAERYAEAQAERDKLIAKYNIEF